MISHLDPCCLVSELVADDLDHAIECYGDQGSRRSTVNNPKPTLRSLVGMFGDEYAEDFGPKKLKELRSSWIELGLSRTYCNDQLGVVKRVFKFGVSEELVRPDV